MDIASNVSLASYSTMGLGGNADYLVSVKSTGELDEAIKWRNEKNIPALMIGGGSNIIWKDEGFKGLVIVNDIKGFETKELKDDKVELTVAGGEEWDLVVQRACDLGLSGIEGLSLIPGLTGATPVQNVGAYGQEISDVLSSVHAYDNQTHAYVDLSNEDCGFSYRNSRFKAEPTRFFIVSITLLLGKNKLQPPFYESLEKYLNEHHIINYSPKTIREAVINIRRSKLPDPKLVKNCGSFFANPIGDSMVLKELMDRVDHSVPHWWTDDGHVKLSAAWLIDQAGFSDHHDKQNGMATWPAQPLILINESAKSTKDLLDFKQKIVEKVKNKFGIELVQEPELLP